MIRVGIEAEKQGMMLAEKIRNEVDGIKLQVNCGGGSIKSQFKKADKSGASYAIIIGEDEASREEISLKPLRSGKEQKSMAHNEVIQLLKLNYIEN